MKLCYHIITLALLLWSPMYLHAIETSIYTDLDRSCEILAQTGGDEAGGQAMECPGTKGLSLIRSTDDDRDDLSLKRGDTVDDDLGVWHRMTSSFQHLGGMANA